jgi:predicted DNA-binding transcriptional regulator YafY
MLNLIRKAMRDSDQWVVAFTYCDSKGNQTRRVVSPIRFLSPNRFLGLCLSREECRQFYLNRCRDLEVIPAHECLMPLPIESSGGERLAMTLGGFCG